MTAAPEHTEHEDHAWSIEIPNHEPRSDSPEYLKSRKLMNEILMTIPDFYYGCGLRRDPAGAGSANDSP